MPVNQLEIEINKFRAIQKARISLNGITVISGENGSGKSTISKLMYQSVNAINQYEELAYIPLLAFYKNIIDVFTDVLNDIFSLSSIPRSSKPDSNGYTVDNIPQIVNAIKSVSVNLKKAYKTTLELKDYSTDITLFLHRLQSILSGLLESDNKAPKEWDNIIDRIVETVDQRRLKVENDIDTRSLSRFTSSVSKVFDQESLSDKFNLYEFGVCITDSYNKRLLNFNSVEKTLYIDTPMAVGLSSSDILHWNHLNEILKTKNKYSTIYTNSQIYHFLSDDILDGEANYNADPLFGRFTYKRKDGLIFNLLDCATGIKSFSILQILLKNGYLDNKTLLIIDEPEAHLHPQWIVEYARIIALLNKELGVKFLIASHNPDMISAIKYISEKEEIDNNLNFYLAEKDNEGTYSYKSLGTEIDEIFNSFNIAIDRINQYGALDNEIF